MIGFVSGKLIARRCLVRGLNTMFAAPRKHRLEQRGFVTEEHRHRFLCSTPPKKTETSLWDPNPHHPPPSRKDLLYATLVAAAVAGVSNAGLKLVLPSNAILEAVVYSACSYVPFFRMVSHTNATGKHWILCTWFLGPVLIFGGILGTSCVFVVLRGVSGG